MIFDNGEQHQRLRSLPTLQLREARSTYYSGELEENAGSRNVSGILLIIF